MKGYVSEEREKCVVVLICGLILLVDSIEELCIKCLFGEVIFDFYKEVFEF